VDVRLVFRGSAPVWRQRLVVERILEKGRVEIPGVPLKPGHEPLPLFESLPLPHEDFVLLALRAGAGYRRRAPAE
jgi:hypothetical protein